MKWNVWSLLFVYSLATSSVSSFVFYQVYCRVDIKLVLMWLSFRDTCDYATDYWPSSTEIVTERVGDDFKSRVRFQDLTLGYERLKRDLKVKLTVSESKNEALLVKYEVLRVES